MQVWEDEVGPSRPARWAWEEEQASRLSLTPEEEDLPNFRASGISLVEVEDGEEILLMGDDTPVAQELPKHMIFQAEEEENGDGEDGPFSPAALQRYGFEALVQEIRRTVRQELENERGTAYREEPVARAEENWSDPAGVEDQDDIFADLFAPPPPVEPLWEPHPEETPVSVDDLLDRKSVV